MWGTGRARGAVLVAEDHRGSRYFRRPAAAPRCRASSRSGSRSGPDASDDRLRIQCRFSRDRPAQALARGDPGGERFRSRGAAAPSDRQTGQAVAAPSGHHRIQRPPALLAADRRRGGRQRCAARRRVHYLPRRRSTGSASVERAPLELAAAEPRSGSGERLAMASPRLFVRTRHSHRNRPAARRRRGAACASLVPRKRMEKVLRIARAFGFEPAASPPPAGYRCGFWENLLLWALAWRFNPSTLRRNGVLRGRCELWISRGALIAGCTGLALVIRNKVRPDRNAAISQHRNRPLRCSRRG